jgi:hypothetical protein
MYVMHAIGLFLCWVAERIMCCCTVWTVSTVLSVVHVRSSSDDVHAKLYVVVLILVYISDAPMQMKAKARVEELEQRLRGTESTLHGELDELKRDYNRQVEQSQRLERDHAQRDSEASSALARLDAVHAELEDKTYQLENTLAQLEKAELKAAKEARMRLELERSLRRLKNPGAMGSSASLLEGDRSFEQESGAANASAGRATVVNSRLGSQRSMYGATGVNSDASVDARTRPSASASAHNSAHKPPLSATRARPSGLDVSHDDLASTSGASFIAAQEFDPARDLPSPTVRPQTQAGRPRRCCVPPCCVGPGTPRSL